MTKISEETLDSIQGGINLTGTFMSAILHGLDIILELGRSLGSALRRSHDNSLCSY